MPTIRWLALFGVMAACTDADPPDAQQPSGVGETVFTRGESPDNPFFHELGTNQRTCETCHDRAAGWSITPTAIQGRFDASGGNDPLFRAVDGAGSPRADVSTLEARRTAYVLLLSRGLIRVGQPLPANAEFTLTSVSDPNGFASASELSLFRRPLPATNLRFVSQIMWDGREPSLAQQASDATKGHAQATDVVPELMDDIASYEAANYTALRTDEVAGDLSAAGGGGGAQALVAQPFTVGINDPAHGTFDRNVFTLYAGWENADRSTPEGERRASIARGERIFNTERLEIRGVAGLADQDGTCSTCHDTPNVGSHSVAVAMDIGVSGDDTEGDRAGLPLYTLSRKADGRVVRTTDPGLALVTGTWLDIGRFKVPALRGLALRPPYFHNGMAENLDDVVRFYRRRFDMRLSDQEQVDLVAFLSAL